MKPTPYLSKTTFKKLRRKGFALVVTLSLMILLTVVAVGLLSLATISLRSETQGQAMATARSNARMALMLAIGDLQKFAGSDRAITAPASIMDAKNPLGVTGVWTPWEVNESGTSRSSTARDNKFRQWLLSSGVGKPADLKTPPVLATSGGVDTATLLGSGSLGKRTDVKDQKINLAVSKVTNGKGDGAFAWAVIDENIKARADLYENKSKPPSWTNVMRAGAPVVDGVRTFDGWDKFAVTDKNNGKFISLASVPLDGVVAKDAVSVCDPDATVCSSSLMTDPVSGGLKKDLSMMSSRTLGGTETSMKLYRGSGAISDAPPSDPYLSLLTNYHQLYKRLGVREGTVRPGPWQVAAKLPARSYTPYSEDTTTVPPTIIPNRAAPTEPVLVPSVLRVDIIFSMITRKTHGTWAGQYGADKYLLHMQYLPVVTLHNPYSVPLVFEGMKVVFKNLPVGFNFMVDGQDLSSRLVPINQMYSAFAGSDSASKDFGVSLKTAIGSTSGQTITMQPGQTKLFGMPKVTPDWTWLMESPGSGADGINLFDWRNDKTSNFDMAPTMITPPTGGGAGFDIDWINPQPLQTAKGQAASQGNGRGMVCLQGTEQLGVKFGPYAPPAGQGKFTITVDLLKDISNNPPTVVKAGAIEVKYGDVNRLNEILSNGTSVRFPTRRTFQTAPEIFPKPGVDPPINVGSIYEDGNTKLKDYVKSKQFMIFSVAAKTTMESFLPAKTLLTGNPSNNVAMIDLSRSRDPEGGVPLEMVMMPIRAGKAAIEENRTLQEGYFFGGNGSLNGTPRATLYEFPVGPLTSLAQFRHANLAGSGLMPFTTYTVGESVAHPQIGTGVLRQTWTDRNVMLDHSYLANESLWDHYFLSTIADQSTPLFGANKPYGTVMSDFFKDGVVTGKLPNSRFEPYNKGSKSTPSAVTDTAAGNPAYQRIAAYLMLNGGFNVNSTSVDAWKAVLAALDGADIDTALDLSPLDAGKTDRYPVPRIRRPADRNLDDDPLPVHQKRWQGYRRLNKSQITQLAEEIVKEVRTRGPFLSLSDFVNRSVGAENEQTLKGAIQAALDRSSGINNIATVEGKTIADADVASNGYKSVKAGVGNTAAGAPGFVTQGDILSAIGSRITVRSDTFRIRAYGEARDASGKVVLAKSYCEAVVRRVPDFVDPVDTAYTAYTALSNINKTFGRRYEIMSFRWLNDKEV